MTLRIALVGLLLVALSGCQSAPPKPPDVDGMSSAQVERIYKHDIAEFRENLLTAFPDAIIPEVTRVRFVDPQEWPLVFSECVTSEGFEAHPADGGVKYEPIPDAQAEAQNLAVFVCRVKYPVHPQFQVTLTDAELKYLYWYFTTDLKPCLEAANIEVPDAPSETVFIENYSKDGGWDIYKHAVELSGDAWTKINTACPQVPPALYPGLD